MYPDFLELLRVLEKHRVAYALIGGYAVGIHAEPRATKDLDLVVAPTPKNAKALLKALKEFGAPIDNLSEQDLVEPGLLYVFGVPPLRVDILNRLKGVDVTRLVKRANRVKLGNTTLREERQNLADAWFWRAAVLTHRESACRSGGWLVFCAP